jgi:hypothetical protein
VERGNLRLRCQGRNPSGGLSNEISLPDFVITTVQRDAAGRLMPDTALMDQLKPVTGKLTEIPVRMLYDDVDVRREVA